MLKRIGLFLLTNLVVMMTISVLLFVAESFAPGLFTQTEFGGIAAFSLMWGMTGSLVSLLMSKQMAKWSMGVQVLDAHAASPEAADLVRRVHSLARQAGLTTMPEVGVFESDDLNAFATGPTRNNSMVAVSTGLLRRMSRSEADAVLAHEVSHIANGDMVTMALIQGVVNAFVLFAARAIAMVIANGRDERDRYFARRMITFVLEILFSIAATLITSAFSRAREYRADAGAARLVGPGAMVAALQRLGGTAEVDDDRAPALAAFKIRGRGGWSAWFSTHPPIEARIEALRAYRGGTGPSLG
jgi:heat shock protein HtpX